jgi:TetR/AcrR family transcriptional repressor of nem operon
MGHSKASKASTHARLVKTAAAKFKEHGIDGISLADLMKELDLTHGGFYKHFASRDALVSEALEHALRETQELVLAHAFDGDEPSVGRFIKFYLEDSHREGREAGCAVLALSGDVARKSEAMQTQFRKSIEGTVAMLARALEPETEEPRETALMLLCSLYGAMMMARAVGDSPLSREVLRTARAKLPAAAGGAKKKRRPAAH